MKKLSFKSMFIVLTVLLLGISNNAKAQELLPDIPISIIIRNYSSTDKMYIFEVQNPDLIPPYRIAHIGVVKTTPPGTLRYDVIPVSSVPAWEYGTCKLRLTTTDGNSTVATVFRHVNNLTNYGTFTIDQNGGISYIGGRW